MVDIYRGLRCRPGDLAVIVQDEPQCQANIGQLVRVIEEYTQFREELGVHWLVQPLSACDSPVLVEGRSGQDPRVVWDNQPRAHYDGWLRPLLESNDADEMTEIAGIPLHSEWRDPVHCRIT
jgi:hypothetical protein